MKTHLKVVLAVAALCGAFFSQQTAQAVIVDLTTKTTEAVMTPNHGAALFSTDFTKGTGSGAFNTFLRIENSGSERGYNTSAPKVLDNKPGAHTKDIRLSEMAVVGDYYSFVIDINESNAGTAPLITLDALKIFTSPLGGQSTTNINSLGTLRFDLDAIVDTTIRYNDANSGSGQSDIAFLIPISAFGGALPTDFVILYAEFGYSKDPGFDGRTDSGFEEFKTGPGIIVNVPEVTSLLPLTGILGLVLGVRHLRRPRRSVKA